MLTTHTSYYSTTLIFQNPLGLPSDLFGNEVDVKGLKRIVPVTGNN